MINYCLCTVWKEALQTKYVMNFSSDSGRAHRATAKTFLVFLCAPSHITSCLFLCALFSCSNIDVVVFFCSVHCSLCFFISHCGIFMQFFFLLLLLLTPVRFLCLSRVPVCFCRFPTSFNGTFNYFSSIYYSFNKFPSTHFHTLYYMVLLFVAFSFSRPLLFQFHSIHGVNWML